MHNSNWRKPRVGSAEISFDDEIWLPPIVSPTNGKATLITTNRQFAREDRSNC